VDDEMLREARWCAVYGATVAVMCRERFEDGRGPASEANMDVITEEACAVAEAAEAAWNRANEVGRG